MPSIEYFNTLAEQVTESNLTTKKILEILTKYEVSGSNFDNMLTTLEKCKNMFGNITVEQAILELDIIRRL